jgi:hypothetical protein
MREMNTLFSVACLNIFYERAIVRTAMRTVKTPPMELRTMPTIASMRLLVFRAVMPSQRPINMPMAPI